MAELVQIDGIDGVRRVLARLGTNGKKHARKLVRGVADAIVEEAKPLIPVQEGVLLKSVVARSEKDQAGVPFASVKVKPNAFYWRFLEYGSGPDGIEHAFFMRARSKVFSDIDRVVVASFLREMTRDLKG